MSILSDFAANLGFGKSSASQAADQNLEDAKAAYGALKPPTLTQEHPDYASVTEQTPTDMGTISVDPAYKSAQMDQLAALSNLAKNGGRSAASDAELARTQAAEQQNARGQRGAVMQNAAARGMGGSGAELVAQLSANQNAQNNQNAEDLGTLGNEANTAINAGMGAANIGSNLENTDYSQAANKAQAQDAINRFNASNKTANSQYNTGTGNAAQQYNTGLQQTGYQNQVQKQAGIAGTNMAGVNYNQAQANMGAQQAGNLLGGGAKLGAAALMASKGGKVPGAAPFKGDTTLNDIVPIDASPGEVVVPRTLAKGGSGGQIANFVKHPPKTPMNDNNKEAMLSALQSIRRKRGGM